MSHPQLSVTVTAEAEVIKAQPAPPDDTGDDAGTTADG